MGHHTNAVRKMERRRRIPVSLARELGDGHQLNSRELAAASIRLFMYRPTQNYALQLWVFLEMRLDRFGPP